MAGDSARRFGSSGVASGKLDVLLVLFGSSRVEVVGPVDCSAHFAGFSRGVQVFYRSHRVNNELVVWRINGLVKASLFQGG